VTRARSGRARRSISAHDASAFAIAVAIRQMFDAGRGSGWKRFLPMGWMRHPAHSPIKANPS
jgi:hypothetical protein